jgi:nucleotidyltransferase/DNA polymerase involved in DNA repair
MQKPNGQHALGSTRQEVLDFVRELPIRKVSGIGKVAEKVLGALGIHKCGDLYAQRAALHCLFSEGRFDFLMRVALGVGHGGDEDSDGRAKSISHERTFGEMSRRGELLAMCRELCEAVAGDLRRKQCRARTITLKIKTIAFEVSTRQVRLPAPADCPDILYARCAAMLRTLMADGTLRYVLYCTMLCCAVLCCTGHFIPGTNDIDAGRAVVRVQAAPHGCACLVAALCRRSGAGAFGRAETHHGFLCAGFGHGSRC